MGEVKEQPVASNKKADVTQSIMTANNKASMSTFVSVGNDEDQNDSLIEMDLVYVRQKGKEERFLKIELSGHNITDPSRPNQYAIKVVNTKEEFEKLKSFFTQLEWDK